MSTHPTTRAGAAAPTGNLDEVRRWEHAAATRLAAEDENGRRLEHAQREAEALLRDARHLAEQAADRRRADILDRAGHEADEVRAAGDRAATALEAALDLRMPGLVSDAVALLLPDTPPATPRTES